MKNRCGGTDDATGCQVYPLIDCQANVLSLSDDGCVLYPKQVSKQLALQ